MTLEKENFVILHGTKGSPEGNWFAWLKEKLSNEGYNINVPTLPTPENQAPAEWFQALKDQNIQIDENTTLIGHSCGATFMLHILENQRVKKSIFVSVVMDEINIPEYDALNKPFLKTPDFDWLTISNNAPEIVYFHGEDDPYVSPEHSEFLQDQIGGDLFIIPDGGHLNSESGYIEFNDLYKEIFALSAPLRLEKEKAQLQ